MNFIFMLQAYLARTEQKEGLIIKIYLYIYVKKKRKFTKIGFFSK